MTKTPDVELILQARESTGLTRVAFCGGVAIMLSRPAPHREQPQDNEDAAGILRVGSTSGVLAVADGVGGIAGGGKASILAVEVALEFIRGRQDETTALRDLLVGALDAANAEVLGFNGAGATTITLAAVEDGTVRVCNVGDSEALVTGQRGRIKFRSTSHSPVGYAIEAGLLDANEALHHEERHVVSNTLGSTSMSLDIGAPVTLSTRDTLLLGSDGVFDNVLVDEIVQLARKGPADAAAEALARHASDRMAVAEDGQPSKPDDMTLILFRPGGR
ncbi:MAG: protein phosphatase 2C domain-containing protein [Planctomycetes bacterium]|nr:protein phosphatase 2C domain-containing protein [Planctomycetota bacterium]